MTDELVERLVDSLRRLQLWQRFENMQGVGAFALSTDDSLATLSASVAPTGWLNSHLDHLFWPPDWPLEDGGDEALEAPWEVLKRRYQAALAQAPPAPPGEEDISAHIRGSFAHFVDALAVLRVEQFFPSETVLLVCVTTPTPAMLNLASDAVARLNRDEVITAWNTYWKR